MSVTSVTLPTNQSYFLVDSRTAPNKSLILPAANTMAGRYIFIKDYYGNASRSTIYIKTSGSDTIYGASALATIASSWGSLALQSDGVSRWNVTNYYSGSITQTIPAGLTAAAATVSYYGTWKIYAFTTPGTYTISVGTASFILNYLIVGGGGGGGVGRGGGGGGGGVITGTLRLPIGYYTVTVGAGGSNAYNDQAGGDGGSSSILSTTIPTLVPSTNVGANFGYVGYDQYWTCPSGVTQVTITLYGAGGGNYNDYPYYGPAGGKLSGTLYTVPGATYRIIVGQGGRNEGGWWTSSGQAAYGGGGAGHYYQYGGGAGGGGRTAVYDGNGDEILVAGGGGGCGAYGYLGGFGGGDTGGQGEPRYSGGGGTGGTQSGGGYGAYYSYGSKDQGANAYYDGGGGGGGWYGGGPGSYGYGGGGGSSYYTQATLNGSNMFVMTENSQGTAGNGIDPSGNNATGLGHDSNGHGKLQMSYSIAGTSVALGGGGGGGWSVNAGRSGASGGGASAGSAAAGGTGTQGYPGASRLSVDVGGGGGGAGGAASGSTGGGGVASMITGTTTYYGGGGGAGADVYDTPGVALGGTADYSYGTYGGGNGANTGGTHHSYQDGAPNTGGGGGGQEGYTGNSGAGGSGLVLLAIETSTSARFSVTPTVYLQAVTYSGTGTWYDSSPNGFNATIENGTASKNLAQNGIVLDGATNWVFNDITAGNTWTLCVWYKNTGSYVGTNPCIVSQIYSGGSINIVLGYGANIGGSFHVGGVGWQTGTSISITYDTWTNYYITWDGTSLSTYINGSLQGTTYPSYADSAATNQYRIGRRWDSPDYMVGEIGEVVIFSGTAFTSTQVYNDYIFRQRIYWTELVAGH